MFLSVKDMLIVSPMVMIRFLMVMLNSKPSTTPIAVSEVAGLALRVAMAKTRIEIAVIRVSLSITLATTICGVTEIYFLCFDL
jgi:hypothetical protein